MLTQNLYMKVHSSIIHSSQKKTQIKCPPADEWVGPSVAYNELLKGHKRKKVLNYTIWINREVKEASHNRPDIPFI